MVDKCDIENFSFTDKVKYLFDNIKNGKFSFTPNWDKNLSNTDDTLQKVLDKIDDFNLKEYQLNDEDEANLTKVIFNHSAWADILKDKDTLQKVLDEVNQLGFRDLVDVGELEIGKIPKVGADGKIFFVNPESSANIEFSGLIGEPEDSAKLMQTFEEKSTANFKMFSNLLKINKSKIAFVGDSVTHGAYALDIKNEAWANRTRKSFQKHIGTESLGFVTFAQDSEGWNKSLEHSIQKTGTWIDGLESSKSYSGYSVSSSTANDELNIEIQTYNKYVEILHIGQTAEAKYRVYVNEVFKQEVVVPADSGQGRSSFIPLKIGNNLTTNIKIKVITGTVELVGAVYSNKDNKEINIYAQSGRKLLTADDSVIDGILQESGFVVWALGINDRNLTGADKATVLAKLDMLKTKSIEHKTPILIVDFLWDKRDGHWLRDKFREIESGMIKVLDLPMSLSYNKNVINMFSTGLWHDSVHPKSEGHRWISQSILSYLRINEDVPNNQEYFLTKLKNGWSAKIPQSGLLGFNKILNSFKLELNVPADSTKAITYVDKDVFKYQRKIKATGYMKSGKSTDAELRIGTGKDEEVETVSSFIVENGYYSSTTGGTKANDDWRRISIIICEGYKKAKISHGGNKTAVAFLDVSRDFISSDDLVNGEILIPSNAKYMNITITDDATTWEAENNEVVVIMEKEKTITTIVLSTATGYWNASTGGIKSYDDARRVEHKIPITHGQILKMNHGGDRGDVIWLNGSDDVISSSSANSELGLEAPLTCAWALVNITIHAGAVWDSFNKKVTATIYNKTNMGLYLDSFKQIEEEMTNAVVESGYYRTSDGAIKTSDDWRRLQPIATNGKTHLTIYGSGDRLNIIAMKADGSFISNTNSSDNEVVQLPADTAEVRINVSSDGTTYDASGKIAKYAFVNPNDLILEKIVCEG